MEDKDVLFLTNRTPTYEVYNEGLNLFFSGTDEGLNLR